MTDTALPTATEEQRATNLSEIRVGIDSVDDQIHALLLRRAEFVEQVAATKRLADGTLPKGAYRPAREASIMRRLHAQNRSPLPFSIVFTCWREIIGGFTAMQNPVSISVQALTSNDILDTARAHFGAAAQISPRETLESVVQDIAQDAGTIGVASARFEDTPEDAWWLACMGNDAQSPRVISALPFYGDEITAYCLSHAPLEESGDDDTLIAVQFDTVQNNDDIDKRLDGASLKAEVLHISGNTALIKIAGFHVEQDAPMHQTLAKALDVQTSQISVIGAYPTPIRKLSDKEE